MAYGGYESTEEDRRRRALRVEELRRTIARKAALKTAEQLAQEQQLAAGWAKHKQQWVKQEQQQAAEKAARLQMYKREEEARQKEKSRERARVRWQNAAWLGKKQRQQAKLQRLPGQKWSVNQRSGYEKKGQGNSASTLLWRRPSS